MNQTFEDVHGLLKPGEFTVSFQSNYPQDTPYTAQDTAHTGIILLQLLHLSFSFLRRPLCLQCSPSIHGISQLRHVWVPGERKRERILFHERQVH
jgi:hypothetical protein